MTQHEPSGRARGAFLLLFLGLLLLGTFAFFAEEEADPTLREVAASPSLAASRIEATPPAAIPPVPSPAETPRPSAQPSETIPEDDDPDLEEDLGVTVTFGDFEEGVEEEEPSGPRLEGHVYAPDRRPLPDARLVLYRLGDEALAELGASEQGASLRALPPDSLRTLLNSAQSSVARSRDDGSFALSLPEGVPGDPYLLCVRHRDHCAVISTPFATLPLEPLEIVLPESGELQIEFEVPRGVELSEEPSVWVWAPGAWAGSVPAAGLKLRYPFDVHVEAPGSEEEEPSTTFALSGFGEKKEPEVSLEPRSLHGLGLVEVVVTAPSCARYRRRVELEPGRTQRLVVPLRPVAPIKGLVVDRSGRALAGVGLIASGPQGGPLAQSDSEGRFTIELELDQEYTLSYFDPGLGRSVEVGKTSPGDEVRVEVDRSGRGRLEISDALVRDRRTRLWVETADGARIRLGVTGAWNWGRRRGPMFGREAERSRRRLELEGRVLSSAELAPGDYVLRGRREDEVVGGGGVPFTIHAGRTTKVRAGLRPGLSVRLVARVDGEPPREGSVGRVGAYRDTPLESDGGVQLSGIDPRGEVFVVRVPGCAPQRVTLPGDQSVVTVALGAGVTLSGVVRDARGAPLPGARLMIQTEGGRNLDAISDHQGRYQRPFLEPGRTYRVVLFVPYERKSLGEVALPEAPGEYVHDLVVPD